MGPDNYWYGARPQILLDRRGAGVDEMIAQVRTAVARYPYPNTYRPWPGPNSNTFLAHIARQVRKRSVRGPAQAAARVASRGCQFQGRSSAMRRAGWSAMRARTSAR
jgi:hypothetical protein